MRMTAGQSPTKREHSRIIPAFDYLEGLRDRRQEIMSAIARVLESGQLVLGPEVTAFETEFARFVGAKYAGSNIFGNGLANYCTSQFKDWIW